jgi:uncharacterized protein YdbL (DUF1318 family)
MTTFIQRRLSGIRTPHHALLARAMLIALAVVASPTAGLLAAAAQPPRQRDRDRERDHRDDADDPSRAELKKRFEARLRDVNELKDKGFVGETFEGYLAALDQRLLSKAARRLVEDENEDRKALYESIANRVDEGEKDVPARGVAQRNGRRHFEKADAQHFLRSGEHHWFLKRDEARAERISRLKNEGVIGETFNGDLEVIDGGGDDVVRRLIEQENRDRRALYDRIARQIDKSSAEQIARQMAKEMQEHLPAGQAFKDQNGKWERRPERQR